jgi:hypothetical protein
MVGAAQEGGSDDVELTVAVLVGTHGMLKPFRFVRPRAGTKRLNLPEVNNLNTARPIDDYRLNRYRPRIPTTEYTMPQSSRCAKCAAAKPERKSDLWFSIDLSAEGAGPDLRGL